MDPRAAVDAAALDPLRQDPALEFGIAPRPRQGLTVASYGSPLEERRSIRRMTASALHLFARLGRQSVAPEAVYRLEKVSDLPRQVPAE